MKNFFFEKAKNITANDVLQKLSLKKLKKNFKINDIKELDTAEKNDISFFHSKKYSDSIKSTNSKIVITNKKLSKSSSSFTLFANLTFTNGKFSKLNVANMLI